MSDLQKTKKLCSNGHLMDPAWERCPYCPGASADQPTLDPTIKMESGASPRPQDSDRRTRIMDRPPAIQGIGFLVGVHDGNRGQVHRLDAERATVGSDRGCEIVLEDTHVSERHASIRFRDGTFVVTDLDSTNGTYLDGEEVRQETLSDGQRIRFGSSEWVFKCVVFDAD